MDDAAIGSENCRPAKVTGWLGLLAVLPCVGIPFAIAAAVSAIGAERRVRGGTNANSAGEARLALALAGLNLFSTALFIAVIWRMPGTRAIRLANLPKSDFWLLAVALEAYRTDHGEYPASSSDQTLCGATTPGFRRPGASQLATLTTPTAYAIDVLADACSPGHESPYGYFSNGADWILFSVGVDQDQDIDWRETTFEQVVGENLVALIQYDPTNGHCSSGDIVRRRPRQE